MAFLERAPAKTLAEPQQAKPQTDLWSLSKFKAWLEQQHPEGQYDFMNCSGGCLLGQYVGAKSAQEYHALVFWPAQDMQSLAWKLLCLASKSPNTFGAALSRVKAAEQSGELS